MKRSYLCFSTLLTRSLYFLCVFWAPVALAQTLAKAVVLTPFSSASGNQPPAPWRVVGVPGAKIPLTNYAIADMDARKVLWVQATQSYGNLVHDLPAVQLEPSVQLRWRWRGGWTSHCATPTCAEKKATTVRSRCAPCSTCRWTNSA